MNKSLNLFVRSREGVVYQGEIKTLTSVNEQGRFDILPEHANFISLIKEMIIIRELNGGIKELKITNGILRITGKNIEIYLGIEEVGKIPAE